MIHYRGIRYGRGVSQFRQVPITVILRTRHRVDMNNIRRSGGPIRHLVPARVTQWLITKQPQVVYISSASTRSNTTTRARVTSSRAA